jgi:hypothetical protein
LREGDEARGHLQGILDKSAHQTLERKEEHKRLQDDNTRENNELRTKVDEQEDTIRHRDDTIHDRDFTINNKNREITEQSASLHNLREMKTINEGVSHQINESE